MKRNLFTCLFLFAIVIMANAQNPKLWGITTYGGTFSEGCMFSVNNNGTGFNVPFSFQSPDGFHPNGNLVEAGNGKLYGTCFDGGCYGSCTIFCYDPFTNAHNDLYSFDIVHGDFPTSGMVAAPNGLLYGAASSGGAQGGGVIYSFDPAANIYTDLYELGMASGMYPHGNPIICNDILYGLAGSGGAFSYGCIYSYNTLTNIFSVLYSFDNINGADPMGSLVQHTNGKLYGMTSSGGLNGDGVIFSFNPSNGSYLKLYDFINITGANPNSSLMAANNGNLYGVTLNGGLNAAGVIFSFDLVNNAYSDLYDFVSATGSQPKGNLMQEANGDLYGTTSAGGGVVRRCHIQL